MIPSDSAKNPPIAVRKKFQVIAEVEVTVYEMPRTEADTRQFGRTPYGDGDGELQPFLNAENALMTELLQSPEDLRTYLSFRAACATDLEDHAFDDWQSGDTYLEPIIERLPAEQQELLSGSCNQAFYDAIETSIENVRVVETTE